MERRFLLIEAQGAGRLRRQVSGWRGGGVGTVALGGEELVQRSFFKP